MSNTKDQGFVVVGVHTPELAPERVPANVRRAVTDIATASPAVIDGDWTIWRTWKNEGLAAPMKFRISKAMRSSARPR